MSVALRAPSSPKLVLVGVEMNPPGRGDHAAAAEENLERLRGADARAQVAGDGGGRPPSADKVDARAVDEIPHLQHRRREANQKAGRFLGLGLVAHAEV